jgi:hypothetical protein
MREQEVAAEQASMKGLEPEFSREYAKHLAAGGKEGTHNDKMAEVAGRVVDLKNDIEISRANWERNDWT